MASDTLNLMAKYLQNGGRICAVCNSAITSRETNALLTNAMRQTAAKDVEIKLAECPNEHLWMEIYEDGVMTVGWEGIIQKIKK